MSTFSARAPFLRFLLAALSLRESSGLAGTNALKAAWDRGSSAIEMRPIVEASKSSMRSAVVAASESVTGWRGLWVARIEHFEKVAFTGLRVRPHYEFVGDGSEIISHVHVAIGPLAGWTSAAGSMQASGDGSCLLKFTSFWVGSDAARPRPTPFGARDVSPADALTQWVGQLLFFESLASFPIDYFDAAEGLVAFRFTPLDSCIVAQRAPKGEQASRGSD